MSAKVLKKPLPKALTVANILNQSVKRIAFTGEWFQAFRQPQDKGVWLIHGGSGSGKSTFILQLAKELAHLEYHTFLNLCEEETDDTDFMDRVKMCQMSDVSEKFLARTYTHDELCEYLDRRQSPKVVIIDSATYFFKDFEQYMAFKKRFKTKIIIITAHARGVNPKEELEVRIMFDAKMKIFVNGYLALCKGRTIGPNGGRYIIWDEGYNNINGSPLTPKGGTI